MLSLALRLCAVSRMLISEYFLRGQCPTAPGTFSAFLLFSTQLGGGGPPTLRCGFHLVGGGGGPEQWQPGLKKSCLWRCTIFATILLKIVRSLGAQASYQMRQFRSSHTLVAKGNRSRILSSRNTVTDIRSWTWKGPLKKLCAFGAEAALPYQLGTCKIFG